MKIYAKIHEAKQEIGVVKKNAKNPHFKNTYADLNALIDAVEPILLSKGLILLQPIDNAKVSTLIIDIETGEQIASSIDLPTSGTPQAMGSAITYYRRYTLQSLLSLQADDDDGQMASKPQPKPTLEWGSDVCIKVIQAIKEKRTTIEALPNHYTITSEVLTKIKEQL
jgi:hypothetical protein